MEALAFVLNIEADQLAERLRVFAMFAHGARKASQLVAHQPRPARRLLTTRS